MHYNNGMENFIRTYDNVLSDEGCNHLIELIDRQTITTNRIRGLEIKDRQMTIDPYFPTLAKEINEDVINNGEQNS